MLKIRANYRENVCFTYHDLSACDLKILRNLMKQSKSITI